MVGAQLRAARPAAGLVRPGRAAGPAPLTNRLVDITRGRSDPELTVWADRWLAINLLEAGDIPGVRAALDRVRDGDLRHALRSGPGGVMRLFSLTALTEAAAPLGDRLAAEALLDECRGTESALAVITPGIAVLEPMDQLRASLLGCLGDLDAAVEHAERALAYCRAEYLDAAAVRAAALLVHLRTRRAASFDRVEVERLGCLVEELSRASGATCGSSALPW